MTEALDPNADWPQPPAEWPTTARDAERGLYDVIDRAFLGKHQPTRRRLIVQNILIAVSRWRETFRDCGCWKTADGYALCGWHERMLQSQVRPLRDAIAARLSPASDEALREAALELVDAIDNGRPFVNEVLRVRAALTALATTEEPHVWTEASIPVPDMEPWEAPDPEDEEAPDRPPGASTG